MNPIAPRQTTPELPLIASGGRARLLGDGVIYASPGLETYSTRHAATVVAAVGDASLRIDTARGSTLGRLLVVRPLVAKRLVARHSPLVLIDLEPNHPLYRCFHGVPDTEHGLGVCALDLAQQAEVRHLAQGFYRGQLCGDAVNQAVQRALERVASAFAAPPPLDPRVAQLMVLLDEDPGSPLPELARRVGLSPHRASQLFSQNMGLPLRRYVLSAKIRRAARFMGSGRRLTDVAQAAGFVDSAHFAKVWILNYGAPPSAFFPAQRTAMDELGLPDWVRWHLARRPAGLGPPSTRSPLIN